MTSNMKIKNVSDFCLINLQENYWRLCSSGIVLFDIDNLILNHNGHDYFSKLNSILERKFK